MLLNENMTLGTPLGAPSSMLFQDKPAMDTSEISIGSSDDDTSLDEFAVGDYYDVLQDGSPPKMLNSYLDPPPCSILDTIDHEKRKSSLRSRFKNALKMSSSTKSLLLVDAHQPPSLSPTTINSYADSMDKNAATLPVVVRPFPYTPQLNRKIDDWDLATTKLPAVAVAAAADSCVSTTCSSTISSASFSTTADDSCVSAATSHDIAGAPKSSPASDAPDASAPGGDQKGDPTVQPNTNHQTPVCTKTELKPSEPQREQQEQQQQEHTANDAYSSSTPRPSHSLQASSSSRFMIALNRLKSQPLTGKRTNTVVPDISLSAPPKRMAASKSSLTERIRNKLSVSSSVVHRKKEKLSCPSTPKPVYRSISTSSISPNRAQVTAAASRRTTPSSTAQRNHQEITPAPKSILKRSASTTCCNLSDEEQAGHRAIKIRSSMMDDLQPLYQIQQQYRRLSPSMQRRLFGKKLKVRFAKDVGVKETFGQQEYDRGSDPHAVCNRLTPFLAQQIKEELNAYKLREMLVHDYSRIHTHFFL